MRVCAFAGVSLHPFDGDDFETLLRKAEVSARTAKEDGHNSVTLFHAEFLAGSDRRLVLGNGLHEAITREQFAVHYQPQLDLRSGALVGAEALLRWNHHSIGPVSPGEFIPIAESNGLIVNHG
ncbi:EAL domain-containing protein [Cyanobium sp. Morenito 9A2]|nr:EAL domain-containing protein [Cyanobium sp. Morenito 9A2]